MPSRNDRTELGADWLSTAERRTDLGGDTTRYGYGASVTALVKFFGPVSLGVFRNEDDADGVFLTVGFGDGIR